MIVLNFYQIIDWKKINVLLNVGPTILGRGEGGGWIRYFGGARSLKDLLVATTNFLTLVSGSCYFRGSLLSEAYGITS